QRRQAAVHVRQQLVLQVREVVLVRVPGDGTARAPRRRGRVVHRDHRDVRLDEAARQQQALAERRSPVPIADPGGFGGQIAPDPGGGRNNKVKGPLVTAVHGPDGGGRLGPPCELVQLLPQAPPAAQARQRRARGQGKALDREAGGAGVTADRQGVVGT